MTLSTRCHLVSRGTSRTGQCALFDTSSDVEPMILDIKSCKPVVPITIKSASPLSESSTKRLIGSPLIILVFTLFFTITPSSEASSSAINRLMASMRRLSSCSESGAMAISETGIKYSLMCTTVTVASNVSANLTA